MRSASGFPILVQLIPTTISVNVALRMANVVPVQGPYHSNLPLGIRLSSIHSPNPAVTITGSLGSLGGCNIDSHVFVSSPKTVTTLSNSWACPSLSAIFACSIHSLASLSTA